MCSTLEARLARLRAAIDEVALAARAARGGQTDPDGRTELGGHTGLTGHTGPEGHTEWTGTPIPANWPSASPVSGA